MRLRLIFLILTFQSLLATAQMDLPGDGGNIRAGISEEVGITSISIRYSRPGVKGREGKIWGDLVPYGFGSFNLSTGTRTSPWRVGANEATVITFEHDVKVEGRDLKAGAYALFMAVEPDSVLVIFSTQTEAWGSFFYREEDDVLRVRVRPVVLEQSMERLKFEFIEHQEQYAVIAMQWENLSVPFKVEVDVQGIILNRLREQMTSVKSFINANLIHGARYCFEHNINLEEALQWAERAVTGRPYGQTSYDAYRTLATGYEKLKRLQQADSVMNQALSIVNINQHIAYGRTLITQDRSDRALAILLNAREKYGDVYAVNNGLSYAYSAQGDFARALDHARKALEQATSDQARATIKTNIEQLRSGKDINR